MKNLLNLIRYKFSFKHRNIKIWRTILIVFFVIVSLLIPIILYIFNYFCLDDDVICSILGLVISSIGIILVINELQDAESINCCEMLSKMNMSFIENERLMLLYQKLDETYRNPDIPLVIDNKSELGIHNSDLVAYFTFYEVMYEYIKHGILDIVQMDDLFGDRFFKLIHNSTVQKQELFAAPSSYANIFQLYDKWIKHREKSYKSNKHRIVASISNRIPQRYMDNKLYFQEKLQTIKGKKYI